MALAAVAALACEGARSPLDPPETGPRILIPPAALSELDRDDIGAFPHWQGLHELPYWLPTPEQLAACERSLLAAPAPRGPHPPLRRMGMQFEGVTVADRRFVRIDAGCPGDVMSFAELRAADPPGFPGDGRCAVCAYCDPDSGTVGACGPGRPRAAAF